MSEDVPSPIDLRDFDGARERDHFAGSGGMANDQLFMTQVEQKTSLVEGGFGAPRLIKTGDKLAMYRAIRQP